MVVAVALVQPLVRGQMPARHLRVLIDVAPFHGCVFGSVS
jgi:hypothetical protein